jgi:hypothetical protein
MRPLENERTMPDVIGVARRLVALAAVLVLGASSVIAACPCTGEMVAPAATADSSAHACCHPSGPALKAADPACCMSSAARTTPDVRLPSPIAVAAPAPQVLPHVSVEPVTVRVALVAPLAPPSPPLVLRI